MKFLKTFENYEPEPETQNIEQHPPMLSGKKRITEFDLEGLEGGDTTEGDDEMPEGISPLGESRSERNYMTRAPKRKSREEIMKMIRQKAGAARRRQLLASKPQD